MWLSAVFTGRDWLTSSWDKCASAMFATGCGIAPLYSLYSQQL